MNLMMGSGLVWVVLIALLVLWLVGVATVGALGCPRPSVEAISDKRG
jgi:hypothetical protein